MKIEQFKSWLEQLPPERVADARRLHAAAIRNGGVTTASLTLIHNLIESAIDFRTTFPEHDGEQP